MCSNCIKVLVEFDVISEEQLKFAIHAIDHVVAAVSLEFLNSVLSETSQPIEQNRIAWSTKGHGTAKTIGGF